MSTAVPIIDTSALRSAPERRESVPSWLVSTIIHMVAVIALGMLHISINPGNNLHLVYLSSDDAVPSEIDTENLTDLDISLALQAEPMSVSAVADSPAPLTDEEVLTSLDGESLDLIPVAGGGASLASYLGDGTMGEMTGETGYASLFGVSGEGGRFVYVFDRSESMNSVFTLYSEGQIVSMITPLHCAKLELIRSLDSLSKANEFQIVFYNDSPFIFGESHYSDQMYRATDANKEHARQFVEQMPGQGFTNHHAAIEAAVQLEPDVIFLLTDAEAKDDLHPSVVRRIFKYCQKRNIQINVVHFCNSPRPDCTLIELAEKTGGEHLFISLQSLAESMVKPSGI